MSEPAFEQHFLGVRFPQPFGAIGAVTQKVQIRGGLGAIQRRNRRENKV